MAGYTLPTPQMMVKIRGLFESLLSELAQHEQQVGSGAVYDEADVLNPQVTMPDAVRFHHCVNKVASNDDPNGDYATLLEDLVGNHSNIDYQDFVDDLLTPLHSLLKQYSDLAGLAPYPPATAGNMVW